ncbi:sulfurtransferase [Litorilinea aerophila]|uniref:Sulfurtransferase n=1 Tax=Litorilinea aerophila TaxID=1204385 RepID=A0A540VIQ1_9CHLR|nr:sulfurtransferase [Litorilinea aerophila]MCC9075822.1 sulfurtransferase [Litorilinea aerophila]GIV77249.1 MAG: sulfurtransferase [Litorilinea sp.]GIV80519.1 MAG: sulfurtransferase [Litorilinea sp.]
MPYTTLISTEELARHIGDPDWAIVDCRFSLQDTEQGRRHYLAAHIPGAVYAHLDEDLSGPIIPGQTGRHPLPAQATFVETLSRWGIDEGVQVVAYDDAGGMVASRLWWMLRWLGHEAVAVLDGGWLRWQREGRPVGRGSESRPARTFVPAPRPELLADVHEVLAALENPHVRLLDARSADRYRGENETLDARAGHIPGAISAPYAENLDAEGCFQSPEALRERFTRLLAGTPPEQAIFYCGSGVSAAHNLLALAHAGLGDARLYVGSWSDWINDPNRPIATGEEPSQA